LRVEGEVIVSKERVKLVANIQLMLTAEQAKSLRDTRERCNAACNEISRRCHDGAATRQFDLRKLIYSDYPRDVRAGGTAAVRCTAKVAASYTTQKANFASTPLTVTRKFHSAEDVGPLASPLLFLVVSSCLDQQEGARRRRSQAV
jgi:hypothetical protein